MPVGALGGGLLGSWIGLRAAMLFGAVGALLAVGWIAFSTVSTLSVLPDFDPAAEQGVG